MNTSPDRHKQRRHALFLFSLSLCLCLLTGVAARAQDKQQPNAESQAKAKPAATTKKPPITKQELLDVLQAGGVAPERVLALVKERGVDFQSSLTDEAELGRAGASAELVEAVSSNYRPRKKSFAEKWNKVFGTPNGSATGDATQGAALNNPTTGDGANAGAANPPAKTLGESVKEIRDAIKQLKKKKPSKADVDAPAQPQTTPSQPPPADPPPQADPPPSSTPPPSA